MMGHMTSAYTSQFEEVYVDAETTPHPTNLAKFFQALYDGYWAKAVADLDEIRTQMHLPTMTGDNLDRWAKVVRLQRGVDEADNEFRIRIYGATRRLFGGVSPDSIIEFAEAVLGAEPGDITIVENIDPDLGTYRAGYYTLEFSFSLLSQLGFDEVDFPDIVATLNEVLQQVSAAGVFGEVTTLGGAIWDTDTWDDPEDLWGV